MALVTTTRRGKPYYIVRWGYYTDENGRQRSRERGFRDRGEALRFDQAVSSGAAAPTGSVTIAQLVDYWLQRHVEPNLQLRTVIDYRGAMNNHVLPHLGRMKAAKLTPRDISKWQSTLVATGASPSIANKALRVLKSALRWARSQGLTECRAADDARRVPQPEPEEANPYTPEQVAAIAAAAPLMRDATLLLTAAYSGLRWSELAALEWDAVDLKAGTIEVRQALDADRTMKAPKTRRGLRTVPVMQQGIDALKQWRIASPPTPLVFPNEHGRPLGRNWRARNLEDIRKRSGIHVQLHQLRDTYASLLIAAGIEPAELTMWLGHSSMDVTLRHYGRLLHRRKLVLVEKANDLVRDLLAAER